MPVFSMAIGASGLALAKTEAFKINGKVRYFEDVQKENQGSFYELEKQRYDIVENMAREEYLKDFFAEDAKKNKTTAEKSRENYLKRKSVVSEKEVKETLAMYKDNPQLKQMPEKERNETVRKFLEKEKSKEALNSLIEEGIKSGKLVVSLAHPEKPVYDLAVNSKTDVIRYSLDQDESKPVGCSDDCPITIVEYSEFQCPYCAKIVPTAEKLLKEYKGKLRWVARDFPLDFHDRAEPASIAAHCAQEVAGEYWHMYETLFQNQRDLKDEDFEKYVKMNKKIDFAKWKTCYANPPETIKSLIANNKESGAKFGVSGTPAFFINGAMLSGALPHPEFVKVINEELKKKKK